MSGKTEKKDVVEVVETIETHHSELVDLSKIDNNKLERLKQQAERITNDNISNLGKDVQNRVSTAADTFLSNIRASQVDELGNTLIDMTKEMSKINVDNLKPQTGIKKLLSYIPGFNKAKAGVVQIFKNYDDISKNIDRITLSLKEGQKDAISDNSSLTLMKEQTFNNIDAIEEELIIAEFKLQQLKEELKLMDKNPEEYPAHEIQEHRNFIENLERRATDLNITRTVMMQSLTDIAIIQQGNELMVQKITSAIKNTLPIWKNTMALGVTLARQNMSIEKLNAFTDYSNEMLRKKAEMIKQNSTAIAQANNRHIIDFETLEKVHTESLETLREIERIQEEGKLERQRNTENIKKLVGEIDSFISETAKKQLD